MPEVASFPGASSLLYVACIICMYIMGGKVLSCWDQVIVGFLWFQRGGFGSIWNDATAWAVYSCGYGYLWFWVVFCGFGIPSRFVGWLFVFLLYLGL